MKPEKYTAYESYIEPVICGIKNIASGTKDTALILLGWWDCEHCKSLHSARVKKFIRPKRNRLSIGGAEFGEVRYYDNHDEVCSKGKTKL